MNTYVKFLALVLGLLSTVSAQGSDNATPNVLWIYIDDMNDWLGCYDHDLADTPNIDRLADEGVRFDRAYMPAPVCSTTRSALITGCMQTTSGTHNHRTSLRKPLPENWQTIPELFRSAGYITFNTGKADYNFAYSEANLYDMNIQRAIRKKTKNTNGGYEPDRYAWMAEIQGRPFFGQIQLSGGKLGGEVGAKFPTQSRINRDRVSVPPQYPDTEIYRDAIARHFEQIMMTDDEVGKIVAALKNHGIYNNTIIFLFTDHGYQLPRAKQFLYEEGIRVPLIISGLPRNQGEVRRDMVSGIDFGVSSLRVAGISVPGYMEGRDFLTDDRKPRTHVIAARDRCDFTIDRIRAVITDRYKYIRNYKLDRPLTNSHYRDDYATMQELHSLHESGRLSPLHQAIYFGARPAEELYDLENDPNELYNLADDTLLQAKLLQHRELLNEWIQNTDDQGQYPESLAEMRKQVSQWGKRAINPEFDEVNGTHSITE